MRLCLTAGTIMHATEKPITYWFKAMWWFTTRKSGVSAVYLQELFGLGSYHTAWTWLQKLRRCTIRKDREKLSFSKLPSARETPCLCFNAVRIWTQPYRAPHAGTSWAALIEARTTGGLEKILYNAGQTLRGVLDEVKKPAAHLRVQVCRMDIYCKVHRSAVPVQIRSS
jgi:hypothetical protein